MSKSPNAIEFVLGALKQEGISHVFMVPGGLIDGFLTEFGDVTGVNAIVAAHEGGAGFMADGYARASGRFGVCLGIGGPGAANLVAALANAYADESPILAVTGEVQSDWEGRGSFQDGSGAGMNDVALMRPVTVFAQEVPAVSLLPHHFHVALRTMVGNSPRPVFLSLPQDLHERPVTEAYRPLQYGLATPPRVLDREAAAAARALLTAGPRIAILAGNGCVRSGATDDLVRLADSCGIPVATTLRAKGVFPEDHRLSLGVFGYGGTRHSTLALTPDYDTGPNPPPAADVKADVLLILGSGLSQRDTMSWSPDLPAVTVQLDIDPCEFGRDYPVTGSVVGDACEFVRWMLNDEPMRSALAGNRAARDAWIARVRAMPRLYEAENTQSNAVPIHPARAVADLRKVAPRDCVLLVDSGAHRVFGGHYWQSNTSNAYLTATAMAPMGWAIPAAIGAKLARPELPCAVVTGDGCMLMHGIEIQTAARHGLAIVYVVINNGALGNVYLRAKQMSPAAAELSLLRTHDWAQFARSLGADGVVVEKPGDLVGAFEQAFASGGTFVVDVRCDRDATTPVGPWNRAKSASLD
jgi:acetolactate synthase I/II/III large subunit